MSVLALLTDTCSTRRNTPTKSASSGTTTPGWSAVLSGVACAVQMNTSSLSIQRHRETGHRQFKVFFEYGVGIASGDIITPASGVASGAKIKALGMPLDHSGHQAYSMVEGEEWDGVDE